MDPVPGVLSDDQLLMFTRDMIQGFIDGFITAGGDPTDLLDAVSQHLAHHPVYKPTPDQVSSIGSDLASYRVTPQAELAPIPVKVITLPPPVNDPPPVVP